MAACPKQVAPRQPSLEQPPWFREPLTFAFDCTHQSTAFVLANPRYGKQSVPVFKIRKEGPLHSIVDMVVQVR
jgi:hypothetical protein